MAARSISSLDRSFGWSALVNASGILSTIPDAPTPPKGAGFGIGFPVSFLKAPVRIKVTPTYQFVSMTRQVNGTGAISDPGVSATHQGHYAGLGLGGTFLLAAGLEFTVWIDGGLEWLYPLRVTQSIEAKQISVQNSGALMLLLFGSTIAIPIQRQKEIELGTHLFYNLATGGRHHLYGVRLGASFLL